MQKQNPPSKPDPAQMVTKQQLQTDMTREAKTVKVDVGISLADLSNLISAKLAESSLDSKHDDYPQQVHVKAKILTFKNQVIEYCAQLNSLIPKLLLPTTGLFYKKLLLQLKANKRLSLIKEMGVLQKEFMQAKSFSENDKKVLNECLDLLANRIQYYIDAIIKIDRNFNNQLISQEKALKEVFLMGIRNANDSTDGHMGWGREPFLPSRKYEKSVLRLMYRHNAVFTETKDEKIPPKKRIAKGDSRIGKLMDLSDRRALDGRGIALLPKHQTERNDPCHRSWGVLYSNVLRENFRTWKESKATENLFLWAKNKKVNPTQDSIIYMTEEESEFFLVKTQETKLFYPKQNKFVADNQADVKKSSEEINIYVADLKGQFYIAKMGANNQFKDRGRIQHPSFKAGERILCAGQVKVKHKKITYIDNISGHYLPGAYSLSRWVDELERRQLLSKDVLIHVRGDENYDKFYEKTRKEYMTLAEFRSILRVTPISPLGRLDLSEKTPRVVNKKL